LSQKCRDAGWAQEQLSFEVGIERNFVSLIERGINQPTVRVLFKLAVPLLTSDSRSCAGAPIAVIRKYIEQQ
jgi:transcriptional regulator with XRE-family HTH domain